MLGNSHFRISSERGGQRFWQLKALGGFAAWLLRSVFGLARQGLGGQETHQLQVRFLTHRQLVVLEGSDLSLESNVELPQYLLLTDDILAVEGPLLPITIRVCMLFVHLLFHASEHLKELIFVLLR